MNIHSLKFKFIIILVSVLGGLLLLQNFYLFPKLKNAKIYEAKKHHEETARHLVNSFEHSFSHHVEEIEAIAKMDHIRSLDKEKIDHELAEINSVTQFFNYLFIVDLNGNWISYPSRPHLTGKKLQHQDWIKETYRQNKTIFLDVILAKTINELVSGFSTPISDENGVTKGLVRGVLSLSGKNAVLDQVKSARIGRNGYAYIVDSKGRLLAHPNVDISPETYFSKDYTVYDPVQKVLLGKSGTTEYEYDNFKWIAFYQQIPTTGWGLIIQQPLGEIVENAQKDISFHKNILIFSFLVIGIILTLLIQKTLTPLSKLQKAIRTGKPYTEKSSGQDEVSVITREFNKYREQLEDLVSLQTEELKLSEEKLRSLVETTSDWFWEIDTKGIYTYSSPQTETMLGYTAEEILGKKTSYFMSPENAERAEKGIASIMNSTKPFSFVENILFHKKGYPVILETNGVPVLNEGGELQGFRGICRDITEKKRMEKETQRAKNIESLGVLAGGIAHDFNNLLTAVFGNIDLAKINTNPSENSYKFLSRTEGAIEKTRNLTRQLLTFAKGGDPAMETISLARLIDDSSKFILSGSNIVCNFNPPKELWSVEIDKGQMEQVLHNLLLNAKDAMQDGGIIDITAKNIEIDSTNLSISPGNYLKISIKDNGSGIKPDIIPKIFDPYFSTKERGALKGTGLGLAICHSIIKKHGGRITVNSSPGRGAVFHIFLPATKTPEERPSDIEKKDEKVTSTGIKHILVLEDDESVVETISNLLSHLEYTFEITKNGDETVSSYRKAKNEGNPFDIVILDLTIRGGKGGEEAIKELHEIDPEVTAIVASGYADDTVMSNYEAFGFKAAVAKPYNIKFLQGVLSQLI